MGPFLCREFDGIAPQTLHGNIKASPHITRQHFFWFPSQFSCETNNSRSATKISFQKSESLSSPTPLHCLQRLLISSKNLLDPCLHFFCFCNSLWLIRSHESLRFQPLRRGGQSILGKVFSILHVMRLRYVDFRLIWCVFW